MKIAAVRRTVFDTPLVALLLRPLSRGVLRLLGWRAVGGSPPDRRYVLVAAPHTSNWDAFYLLLIAMVLGLKLFWLGKRAIFRWPLKSVVLWLGGVPVDRESPHDRVAQIASLFSRVEDLVLVIAPEGTRSAAARWKTGFYQIALQAQVPLALGYLDYRTRSGGIGPLFFPSDCRRTDFDRIRAFYQSKTGRRPANFSDIQSGV